MTDTSPNPFNRLDYTYKIMVVITLTITGMVLARNIIIPMAFAAILAVVLLPLVKRLEKRRVPAALAISIVLFGTMAIISFLVWLTVGQIVALVNDLPNIQSRLDVYIENAQVMLLKNFGITVREQTKYIGEAMKTAGSYLGDVLLTTTSAVTHLVQIPIYIFLFLIYRDKFKEFFVKIVPGNEFAWKKEIEKVIQGYISGLLLVTLIIATLNSIGLLILGIDYAIFFGVLSGTLTVIPYIGISIGATFPILMALITKDSAWYAVGVVCIFATVQFFEGNFISPRITGSKVSINALAAIVALLIGGKILGIAGMILAVPGIGILKILLSNATHLRPFVILLEDDSSKPNPDASEDAIIDPGNPSN